VSDTLDSRWAALLCSGRRKKEGQQQEAGADVAKPEAGETRTEIERDYDRILFSTPVRRMADKTQVFPLEKNDSVRTRLTHSHEVSNLARSIGTALAFEHKIGGESDIAKRNIPALLATIGLVHDLGNPPFGHQGEAAIQSWFKDHQSKVLSDRNRPMAEQQKQDFLKFEGNAQAFRLVTRLQLLNDEFGLDLTYATLSAMMKYPCRSTETRDGGPAACKKHGFFSSEEKIAEFVQQKVGLALGKRHPFSYVMEACDDIAYVVLDVEDAVKKGLASFSDLLSYIEHHANGDALVNAVVSDSRQKHVQYRQEAPNLSPAELNDVSMQRFRVFAIGALVRSATTTFMSDEYRETFLTGEQAKSLLALSEGERLRKVLKDFAFTHAYNNRAVLELELKGYNVLRGLMDIFWEAITDVDDSTNPKAKRRHPFNRYVYGRISENYRRVYEATPAGQSSRYHECVLLTDMMSGMTDSYAMSLYDELAPTKRDYDAEKLELSSAK
jgi:dGTPase